MREFEYNRYEYNLPASIDTLTTQELMCIRAITADAITEMCKELRDLQARYDAVDDELQSREGEKV
jgi:hypothetical protein